LTTAPPVAFQAVVPALPRSEVTLPTLGVPPPVKLLKLIRECINGEIAVPTPLEAGTDLLGDVAKLAIPLLPKPAGRSAPAELATAARNLPGACVAGRKPAELSPATGDWLVSCRPVADLAIEGAVGWCCGTHGGLTFKLVADPATGGAVGWYCGTHGGLTFKLVADPATGGAVGGRYCGTDGGLTFKLVADPATGGAVGRYCGLGTGLGGKRCGEFVDRLAAAELIAGAGR
jgi:hypothetical protein